MQTHKQAFRLTLLVLLVYLCSYSGVQHSVDELATLAVTETLITTGHWHTNQMVWDQSRTPPQNAIGVDGNLYAKKGVGVSLVALPLFALGKAWGAVGAVQMALLTNTLLTALLAYLFFQTVNAHGYTPETAVYATLALSLGTLLWPYARTLFSESLAALGLGLALYGAGQFRRQHHAVHLVATGVGLTLLTWARTTNLVVAPIFCGYLVYTAYIEQQRKRLDLIKLGVSFGVPLLVGIGLTIFYNYNRFHTLFAHPTAAFETFTTPLAEGLVGLLISPGKGLLWYTPLLWLTGFAWPAWRSPSRRPDLFLAAGVCLAPLLLYSTWYDWPGGRAWGPRLLVMTAPALVLLILPVLEEWCGAQARRWQRLLLFAILGLSVCAQLPGVLINFEQQEANTMQTGVSFSQLLWDVAHAPLLTSWRAIGSTRTDPLLLQPFVWQTRVGWGLGLLLLGVILGICNSCYVIRDSCLPRIVNRICLGNSFFEKAIVGWGDLVMTMGLGVGLVILAKTDPRWQERSAAPTDNQQLVAYLAAVRQPGDLVLLDLRPADDVNGRAWFWMNFADAPLSPYIGWLRQTPFSTEQQTQLAHWLTPAERIWLALEHTDEGDTASNTERWLDQWAYRGRQEWIGSQRLVEYLTPSHTTVSPVNGPFRFGEAVILEQYQRAAPSRTGYERITLVWRQRGVTTLRFSVQALNAQNQVIAQIDRTPGQINAQDHDIDQVGLVAPAAPATLILKVYDGTNGTVFPYVAPDGGQAEYLVLITDA